MARWWQVSDRSTISLGEIRDSDDIPRRKRSKRSSSKLKNINIDDLPDLVLVDILCRLPCNKFAFRCKCVSKRWCAIISDPLFIRRFLCLQSDKHMPIVRTLINYNIKMALTAPSEFTDPVAERSLQSLRGFLPTLSSKLTDLVIERPLEDKLPVFGHEDLKAVVLETYNDLVLCCAGNYYQRDYFICNPYTQKWVALPPSPQCHKRVVALGFICDPPYYTYYGEEAQFHRKEATQQHKGGCAFLIGFDPFDTKKNNHETIDKKCFIEFDEQPAIEGLGGDVSEIECLGVCQGCLRMFNFELRTGSLLVWDFKLPEPADDQMVNGGSNCLILKHRVPMDPRNKLYMDRIKLYALDPNNKDILYFYQSRHICQLQHPYKNVVKDSKKNLETKWCSLLTIDFAPSVANPSSYTLPRQRSATTSLNLFNKTWSMKRAAVKSSTRPCTTLTAIVGQVSQVGTLDSQNALVVYLDCVESSTKYKGNMETMARYGERF
ncbi:hypothetical protein ACE6H2_012042 [Prunus campanulata]